MLTQLTRHIANAAKLAEELEAMRDVNLTQTDREGKANRAMFTKLLQAEGRQSKLIATLCLELGGKAKTSR